MKKLIELDAAIKATWKDTGYTDPLNVMTAIRDRIEALPTVDAVPRGAYDQVRWERDIAVGQLEQLGYALGEKVTPIVRCKDCKNSEHWYRDKRRCFLWVEDGIDVFNDGFCNYGEKDGEQA